MKRFLVYDEICRQPVGYAEGNSEQSAKDSIRKYLTAYVAGTLPGEVVHNHLMDHSVMRLVEMDPNGDPSAYRHEWTFDRRAGPGRVEAVTETHTWNLKRLES